MLSAVTGPLVDRKMAGIFLWEIVVSELASATQFKHAVPQNVCIVFAST